MLNDVLKISDIAYECDITVLINNRILICAKTIFRRLFFLKNLYKSYDILTIRIRHIKL